MRQSRIFASRSSAPVDRMANSGDGSSTRLLGPFSKSGFPVMNTHPLGGISGVDPLRAIDLIWTLRDIRAKRTLRPLDPDHLRELMELGLVEMRDDAPALTNKAYEVLD